METITSRTSNERIIRTGIFMVLVDVFTVLYLWDGYIGYPQQSRQALANLLGVSVDQVAPPSKNVNREWALSYHDSPTEDKIARSLAEPAIAQDNKVYFLGEGGWLDVRVDGRSSYAPGGNAQSPQPVLSVAWVDSPRTESDIRWQKYIGWTLAIVGIFATLFFARVLATRAFLSDQGLQLTGKPLVRWDQMRDLRPDPRKRGVVELEYESNGSRRTLRMDDYLYRDLARITAAIAAKKALNDPLAALQKA